MNLITERKEKIEELENMISEDTKNHWICQIATLALVIVAYVNVSHPIVYGIAMVVGLIFGYTVNIIFLTRIKNNEGIIKQKEKELWELSVKSYELEKQNICLECGDVLEKSDTFCANCGTNLSEVIVNE